MTQPVTLGGRPLMPPLGAPAEERLIARLRPQARGLFWSALVLIVVSGAAAYFFGNLPAGFDDWMLLAAAGVLVLVGVVIPWALWAAKTYTITTRRVIVREGVGARRRREISHVRGYTIGVRRGLGQRLWGAGTVTLSNGVEPPVILKNVPYVTLVHETLADQIEVNQILAHRDAQAEAGPGERESDARQWGNGN